MRFFTRTAAACIAAAAFALICFNSPAFAQSDPQRSGCTRDVSRLCRSVMNDGDSAVLVCLRENRAKLSKACQKVLTDNGQ